MKKIIAALIALVVLVMPTVALANVYIPGVINQQGAKFIATNGLDLTAWTDGDISTGKASGANLIARLDFDSPVHLDYMRLQNGSSVSYSLNFYLGDTLVHTYTKTYGINVGKFEEIIEFDFTQPVDNIRISTGGANMYIYEFEVYELADTVPPGEVNGISYESTETTATFNFQPPSDVDFSHVQIVDNGRVVADNIIDSPYTLEGLEPGSEYNLTFYALDSSDNKSNGVPITVLTKAPPKPLGEITGLDAEATHERVNLSWQIPQHDKFQHVNIYRGSESGENFTIMSAPVKIFETNGTYFNDLTVQPETTYNYRLTTYSTEGVESEGVTTTVTTAEAPPPVIEGGSYTKDPLTGNFIYSWDSPTYGQVKILLGESEFTTVDASLGRVSIPKNQMKYTAFGDPDVTLIAIDGDKTSEPIRPGVDGQDSGDTIDQLKIPFTAQDLLGTGTGLLWLIAPFVLLALAFLVVPKLRNMLFTAISGKSKTDEQVKDGRTVREERTYRESAPERNIRVPREKVERQQREMRMPRQLRGERG